MWSQGVIRRFLCRGKYDYRSLWIEFAEVATGSSEIHDLLPKIAKLIARSMSVGQVAFWARSGSIDKFDFAYALSGQHIKRSVLSLRLTRTALQPGNLILRLGKDSQLSRHFPISDLQPLYELGVERVLPIQRETEVLGFLGVGGEPNGKWSAQDDQFLLSVSSQITHLILTQELSRELLVGKEWDSFNRCASFLLHDLKNLATIQSMTLENARNLRHNADFVTDAFTTFNHTTEKIINLIASLSIQRGQFSLKQQPVNILEVISHTFDELKIGQRNDLRIRTEFPPLEKVRAIRGDPELLGKAFTNLILNAIQSLPSGKGEIDVTISQDRRETVTTSIRDTGCGISPDRLETMFRPFQTTKENGLGIGLCHTRSIIEVHGGEIRIKSELNAGTTVEIDLPAG
jgi:signal transduction histidine kinase